MRIVHLPLRDDPLPVRGEQRIALGSEDYGGQPWALVRERQEGLAGGAVADMDRAGPVSVAKLLSRFEAATATMGAAWGAN